MLVKFYHMWEAGKIVIKVHSNRNRTNSDIVNALAQTVFIAFQGSSVVTKIFDFTPKNQLIAATVAGTTNLIREGVNIKVQGAREGLSTKESFCRHKWKIGGALLQGGAGIAGAVKEFPSFSINKEFYTQIENAIEGGFGVHAAIKIFSKEDSYSILNNS